MYFISISDNVSTGAGKKIFQEWTFLLIKKLMIIMYF